MILVLVLGIGLGQLARAAEIPKPKSDYSADVRMRLADASGRESYESKGREYYSGGKRRREMSMMGHETILIERPDKKLVWSLMPATRSYLEFGEDAEGDDSMPDPLGEDDVSLERIGSESVNGEQASKFRVTMDDGRGTAWMTSDNILVRFEGTTTSEGRTMEIRIDFENIERGTQPAKLFERPADYSKLPSFGGMSGGLGGMPGPPGGDGRAPTDAEVEAYQEQMKKSMEQLREQMEQMGAGQRR